MSSFNWPDVTGGAVSGPGSATDNALVRFDGVTGDLLQNSPVICDDSGNLSGIGTITTSGAVNGASAAEMAHLSGVTSAIQTQLDAKQATITGAATTITGSDLTASRALIANSSGKVAVSSVTDTELGYVSGVTSAIQTQLNAKLALAGGTMTGKITLDGDPSNSLHAATKQYVDGLVNGVKVKEGAKVSSTEDLTLSGEQTIDGVSCVAGDRVLARHQTATEENGVYVVAAGAWARAADANSAAELNNALVTVAQGSTYANTGWYQSAEVATLDTDAVTFVQFFGAGTYTADGSTLSLSGSTFSVANGGIANAQIGASAAIDFSKLAALASANILVGNGSNVATSVSVTGDVTISNAGVTAIASGVVVNDDVKSDAAIAFSKLAALSSGNILLGNASNVAASVAMSGDVTISNAGVTAIASGVIVNADVKSDAAIAGTKIAPDFGSQNIVTTGTVGTSSITATGVGTAGSSLSNFWSNYGAKIQGLSSNTSSLLIGYDGANVALQGATGSASTRNISIQPYGGVTYLGSGNANIDATGNLTTTGIALIGASGTDGDGQIRAGAGVATAIFRNTSTTGDSLEALRIARSSAENGSEVYLRFYESATSAASIGSQAGGIQRNSGDSAYEFFSGSDKRLKGDISPWDGDALAAVRATSIETYKWRELEDGKPTDRLKDKVCKGPIAQNVMETIPEAVSEGEDGYLQLGWSAFYPYWHKAIQQLAERIEALEAAQ